MKAKPKKLWAESQISEIKVKSGSGPSKLQKEFMRAAKGNAAVDWTFVPKQPNPLIDSLVIAASEFGKLGGSVKSEKKAAAARANGKKGGRPRKEKKP